MLESHSKIERNIVLLLILVLLMISVGTVIELVPLFKKEAMLERVDGIRPYTPLELAGFFTYKQEGCYNCHSQQIRTLAHEIERYGHFSLAIESEYDHPFVWGSKRTGPDLARVGGKYSDDWQVQHLIAPRTLVPESIMPAYPFLAKHDIDFDFVWALVRTHKIVGVPYQYNDKSEIITDIKVQLGIIEDASAVAAFKAKYPKAFIRKFDKSSDNITEMDAIVAYLQSLGNKVDLSTNQGRIW